MTLPGYIEASLSDHKPVFVEIKRTDVRAQATIPVWPTSARLGAGGGVASTGSMLHGAGNMQGRCPARGDGRPGVVAIMNAALHHVCGFQTQVHQTLKEWQELFVFAEKAILAQKGSLAWFSTGEKGEKEMLSRAAVTFCEKLSDHFVHKADVDNNDEHLQLEDDDSDDDGDLENVEEEELSLIHI